MKILGLDVGTKRIGVASAGSDTRIAVPVGFVNVDGSEWQEIARLARLNNTSWFVVGLPRSNEGNETKQTLYVRSFAKKLREHIPEAKVRFQDESLTSVEAEERLKSRKKNYQKGDIDAEAATIILQDFLESLPDSKVETELKKTDSQPEILEIAKKEADRVVLGAKKAQHKMKKWPFFVIPLIIIIGAVTAFLAVKAIKEQNARDREAYYAYLESQMQAEVFNFTIRPGETIFDIKKRLIDKGYPETEVDEAFNANYDFDFLKNRPEGASLEGYLYGETYEFYEDASVKEILTKFLAGMGEVITANNLEARYMEQGLTLYEGITLASVVQKESPAAEMPTVAQVFLTRLNYGMTLGSDVTVSYALDVIDPERKNYTDNSAALLIDSCYNTRMYAGLPCGPIASPSLTALLAVAEPSDTSYLFFLTGDDGLMYYSYTESEHNYNARVHCQELCQVSL